MTAWLIVGILLLILLLVQCCRIGVQVTFGEETGLVIRLGLLRLRILPQSSKKKKQSSSKNDKPTQKKSDKEPWKPTFSELWANLPQLWQIVKKGLRMTFRRIRVSPMTVSAVIGGDDPADVAILYGKISAAMYAVMPLLQELLHMPDPNIHLEPALQGGKTKVSGEIGVSFLLWDLTVIGFACGIPLIRWMIHLRKQPQSAAENTNDLTRKDEENGKQAEDQSQRNDGDLHEQGAGNGQQ